MSAMHQLHDYLRRVPSSLQKRRLENLLTSLWGFVDDFDVANQFAEECAERIVWLSNQLAEVHSMPGMTPDQIPNRTREIAAELRSLGSREMIARRDGYLTVDHCCHVIKALSAVPSDNIEVPLYVSLEDWKKINAVMSRAFPNEALKKIRNSVAHRGETIAKEWDDHVAKGDHGTDAINILQSGEMMVAGNITNVGMDGTYKRKVITGFVFHDSLQSLREIQSLLLTALERHLSARGVGLPRDD